MLYRWHPYNIFPKWNNFQYQYCQMDSLDLIIEQSKQYFISKEYLKALQFVNSNFEQASKLHLAYDLAACSNFMLEDYDAANQNIGKAIILNPNIADFYITKAAILRKLGQNDQCIQFLNQAAEMTIDPAINYNLKCLSKNNEQIEAQTLIISTNENINSSYDNWHGIVPSFLKTDSSRSDYIFACQEKAINYFRDCNQEVEQVVFYKKLREMVQMRQMQLNNYGVKLKENNRIIFPIITQILKIQQQITNQVHIDQQQELLQKLFIIVLIAKQPDTDLSQLQIRLAKFQVQVLIRKFKQVQFFKNYGSFNEQIKDMQCLEERVLKLSAGDEPDVHIVVTRGSFIIFVSIQFLRNLSLRKSLKAIYQLPFVQGKEMFHLMWFIFLRVIFCNGQGFDIRKYYQFRLAFETIYEEIDQAENLKFSKQELHEVTKKVFERYNRLYPLPFVAQRKFNTIAANCVQQQSYLQEFDTIFETILKNQTYLNCLTKDPTSQQSLEQQKFYRNHYNLDPTILQDKIVQNLIIIFYHFRNLCSKPHQLFMKALVCMAIETKDTLNGKQSFYRNFYQQQKDIKPETILQQVWRRLSS